MQHVQHFSVFFNSVIGK